MELKSYKSGICGVSCFCDKIADRIAPEQEEPVYFEDEELDAYRGIAPTGYDEAQIAEFREVMTTMRPQEVGDWLHSLRLRGIHLPAQLMGEAAAYTRCEPNDNR